MLSGGGGGSRGAEKKRKADDVVAPPAKREPRRGLGVAELERIRVHLEMAGSCYVVPSLSVPAPPPPPALPHALVAHVPGVAAVAHHQYVGNGAVQVQYFTPYYRAQHYANDPALTRLFASNGHLSWHQKNQVDQIQSVVTALPGLGQAASSSSECSSSAYQQQDHHQAQPRQLGQTARPQVAFVDLVDSDDDVDGAAVEELDLELRL